MPEPTADQAMQSAAEHHQAGRLAEAEGLYRMVLGRQPHHPGALHLLGILASQVGRPDTATALIQRAIAVRPDVPDYHRTLGNILRRCGRIGEAAEAFGRARALEPGISDTGHESESGPAEESMADAIAICREAVRLQPDSPAKHFKLAKALNAAGLVEEAITEYRRAIALNPRLAEAHNNLGDALMTAGKLEEALVECREAFRLKPETPEIYITLGNILRRRGEIDEAVAAYETAIRINPGQAVAFNNLGNAFREKGEMERAIAFYSRALELNPGYADAHTNLGVTLQETGRLDEALSACREAHRLDPRDAVALNNLGNCHRGMGAPDQAIACYREALTRQPKAADIHSNLIFALHFDPHYDARAIFAEALEWDRRQAQPGASLEAHPNDRSPERRLRIGYVSPDFRAHVVGYNLLPLFRAHDRGSFEIVCYSNAVRPDDITEQFRALSDGWREIRGATDEQAAEMIRADRIDILVDLAVHTAHNRLPIFTRKPAPVQATYLGYCGTTGLRTMDYRLSDLFLDPPETDLECYSEETIRLPHGTWSYQPAGPTPGVSPLPASAAGFVTFGCRNHFAKVSPSAQQLWAEILAQVPRSRLLLHAPEGSCRESVLERFADHGISAERLGFTGRHEPWEDFVRAYAEVDIALDPFPYCGWITTCDALWMGVPVVTLFGHTAIGRGGCSILSHLALPELIAKTTREYQEIAVALAGDLPRLSAIRSGLRERMEQSPLRDPKGIAREIEAAFREMWRRWCTEGLGK